MKNIIKYIALKHKLQTMTSCKLLTDCIETQQNQLNYIRKTVEIYDNVIFYKICAACVPNKFTKFHKKRNSRHIV